MNEGRCRFCSGRSGHFVLDLGDQPACDHFPPVGESGPDPTYPLRMWMCAGCGLAQLSEDLPVLPDEPRGVEPLALARQAADAVHQVAAAGLLPTRGRVMEFGSPHGGSWLPLLAERDYSRALPDERAHVIVDSFGLMHEPDQAAGVRERVDRLVPDGVLLLQYHSLASIVAGRQWNALRHGHHAYYTASTLITMLGSVGLRPRAAFRFDLYGGTVLLAASRSGAIGDSVRHLVAEETAAGATDPAAVSVLQPAAEEHAASAARWLRERQAAGERVMGYGAASRAVSMLYRAGIGSDLLPAVADASPAKQGRRMPGSRIPIVSTEALIKEDPDCVLLLLPDLLDEVRVALPQVEAGGGRWVLPGAPPRLVAPDSRIGSCSGPAFVRRATPPVAIGLPVRNGEPHLGRALDSLRAQRGIDFELIIADNCSTDGTAELCRAAARDDRRIRYLRREADIGAVANHNRLVYEARSSYFCWAASDDEYLPDRLAQMHAALIEHPRSVLSYTAATEIDQDGRSIGAWRDICRVDHPDPVVRFGELLAKEHPALHSYGLFRREVLLRTGLERPLGTGDRVLLAEMALHGPFVGINEPLLRRRVHDGQLSRRTSAREYLRAQGRFGFAMVPDVLEALYYLKMVLRAPLPPETKLRALLALRPWLQRHAVPMVRNVAHAAGEGARKAITHRHQRSEIQ
ncbi:MAG: glycosyltransferase [Pseudonocardiaceae bacterium]